MRRYRVYKSRYAGSRPMFYARSESGQTLQESSTLEALAIWIRGDRVGYRSISVDLHVQFKVDDDIVWSTHDSRPQRYESLSSEEQEVFLFVLTEGQVTFTGS